LPDKLSDFFTCGEVRGQRVVWQDGVGRRDTKHFSESFAKVRACPLPGAIWPKAGICFGNGCHQGKRNCGDGDPKKQTQITIQNMQRLYSGDVLSVFPERRFVQNTGTHGFTLKTERILQPSKKKFKRYYENLPVVYNIAVKNNVNSSIQ
jgi:hypothetical protein